MHSPRRLASLTALIALAAVAALLPATSAARPTIARAATQPTACAWPVESTPAKANVAYPDSNATYWTTPFIAEDGMTITLNGTFPTARFFSFVVYNSAGQDFTTNGIPSSLTDYQMVPGAGTQNPWVTAGATPGTYSVTVMNGVTSSMSNAIPLMPSTPSTPLVDGMPANTGFVTMRIYLPVNNNANAIPLPTMTMCAGVHSGASDRAASGASAAPSAGAASAARVRRIAFTGRPLPVCGCDVDRTAPGSRYRSVTSFL